LPISRSQPPSETSATRASAPPAISEDSTEQDEVLSDSEVEAGSDSDYIPSDEEEESGSDVTIQ